MRLLHLLVTTPLSGSVAGKMLLKRAAVADEPQEHPRFGAIKALEKRDIIPWGGYYLLVRDSACPSDTSKCGTSGCCPNGTFCFSDPKAGGYPVCCPDENVDCSETVLRVYACADTSWTMWAWIGENFCCKADEVGTHANFEDRCLPNNVPVPSSIIVKSIDQQTKTVARPTNTGSPGGGTQTTGIASPNGGTSTPTPTPAGTGTGTCNPGSYAKDPTGCSNDRPPVTNFEGTSSGTPNSPGSGSNSGSGTGNSSPSNNNGSDSGLSTPATIAIAVLATALGLALIFMAWFLWYRSHKKKQIAAAAAASSGGTSELPGASTGPIAPQVAQVAASYPPPGGVTTAPVAYIPQANTGPIPVSPQQNLAQTGVVPIHSTPSPGPSLDPSVGPPAYVPPHPHTQELHARGMTPVLEGFQGYGVAPIPNNAGHAVGPNGEQELDGMGRARSPVDGTGNVHPGGNAGGLEDCSPSGVDMGHERT